MGTRSRIAIENDDGSFTSIYCHWDGYPAHQGTLLRDHYTDRGRVRELMALGDLSSLGHRIGTKHSFDNAPKDTCNAYGRDRGETGIEARASANLDELGALTKECGGEWLYVFGQDGKWRVAEGGVAYFGMPASKAPGALRNLVEYLAESTR